jgi:hypothetical protein
MNDTAPTISDVQRWLQTHADGAAKLAQCVSLPAVVDAELLRAARVTLTPELDVTVETEVWFSPLIESRSSNAIIFSAAASQELWTSFSQRTILDRIHDLTRTYRQGIPPAIELEEEIVYLALSQKPDAPQLIEDAYARLLATMLMPEFEHLATWAERALPRLPHAAQHGERWMLLKQAAWARGAHLDQVNIVAAPAWIKPVKPERSIGIRLFGRTVEVSDPPAPDSVKVQVPTRRPVRVAVSRDLTFTNPIEAVIKPDGVTVIEIAFAPELFVQAAGGRTWAIAPLQDQAGRPRVLLRAHGNVSTELKTFVHATLLERGFDVTDTDSDDRGALVFIVGEPALDAWKDPFYLGSRRECRTIVLVRPPDVTPRWPQSSATFQVVDFVNSDDWSNGAVELATRLTVPVERTGELHDVPLFPDTYVSNDPAASQLREALVAPTPGVIALDGIEGSGRRTMAIAAVRDCALRRAFPNGVQWLGRSTAAITAGPGRLVVHDYECDITSVTTWADGGARILLTRPAAHDRSGDLLIKVPPLSLTGFPSANSRPDRQLWSQLARNPESRADYGVMVDYEGNGERILTLAAGNPLAIAVFARLSNARQGGQEILTVAGRHQSLTPDPARLAFRIARELELSTLDDEQKLALVFAPETAVPRSLWSEVIGHRSEDVLQSLVAWNAVTRQSDGSFRVRRMAAEELSSDAPADFHRRIVDTYRRATEGDWALGEDDGYYHQRLIWHMSRAGAVAEAASIVFDYDWVMTTVEHAGVGTLLGQVRDLEEGLIAIRSTILAEAKDFRALLEREDLASAAPAEVAAAIVESLQPQLTLFYGKRSVGLRNRVLARQRLKLAPHQPPPVRLLVAGYGGPQMPLSVVYASEIVGRELARGGYGLLSGGWPGVDHIVCREYVRQLRRDGVSSDGVLTHIIPASSTPDLWALEEMRGEGRLDASGSPAGASTRSVELADAVIAIGGVEGTKRIISLARERNTPVIIIPGLPGAIDEASERVSSGAEPQRAVITSRQDARPIVLDALDKLPTPTSFGDSTSPES